MIRKFLPISIVLLLGLLFIVIIQFGSQGDSVAPKIASSSGQGTQLESDISSIKQRVYSEQDYSRVSATLGASLSTNEISNEEYQHLNSLLNMAKCNSLVLLFDSLRNVDCGSSQKLAQVVGMMKQHKSVVTMPVMDKRLIAFSEIQAFENVVNKIKSAMSKEYDQEVTERLQNELNASVSPRSIYQCQVLLDTKDKYSKYLNDFPSVPAQVETNLKYNIYPSGKTTKFVRPFEFYLNMLETQFGKLN
jgi:hypothetical protein